MNLLPSHERIIRERPQSTRLDLFLYTPKVVMRAVIDDASANKGDSVLHISGLTPTGVNILADTTLWVGSDVDLDDVGHIRIRSANLTGTSGTITTSENSHVDWKNGQNITALKYWEVWPVFPRIIQNPSDKTKVIFYKDYDEIYTNQNKLLGSFVRMGGHRARIITTGSSSVYWDASDSANLDGVSMSYLWTFEGGIPSTSSSVTPGNVAYNTAGDYVTTLRVTSASGTVDTSHRYVSIKDEIGQGDNPPVIRWELKNFSGARGEGGYSADFIVYDNMNIHGNDVVMLRGDNWYGTYHVSLGSNNSNDPEMFFVGYIDKDSIRYDYKSSKVEFTALSLTGIMKKALGFSVSVESKLNPSTWYELYNMNCERAIYHYLKWHSTVLGLTDIEFIGTDYPIQFFDSDRTSLYDSIDELMRSALVGTVCSDRQDKMYIEVEPRAYQNPTGTFHPVFDIIKQDWLGEPQVEERFTNETSYIEAGGIRYSGPNSNKSTPYLSAAPGLTPAYRGNIEKIQGLTLKSQIQLNILSGHLLANANSKFPSISMDMTANYSNLDIAPYEVVDVHLLPEDTVRGIDIHGLYIPDSINWRYDHKNGLLTPSIELKELVNGFPGDTITIKIPDDEEEEFIHKPPVPPIIPTGIIVVPPAPDPSVVICASSNYGVIYTTNFFEEAPVWNPMNNGLIPAEYNSISQMVVTSNGSIYILCDELWGNNYTKVYWTSTYGTGTTWNLLATADYNDPNIGIFQGMGSSPFEDRIAVYGGLPADRYGNYDQEKRGRLLIGNGTDGLVAGPVITRKANSGRAALIGTRENWNLIYNEHGYGIFNYTQPRYIILGLDGGVVGEDKPSYMPFNGSSFYGAYGQAEPDGVVSNHIYFWNSNISGYGKIDDLSESLGNTINMKELQACAVSPTGKRVMAGSASNYVPFRSQDSGASWESLAATIPAGMSVWENVDEDKWIFGGGTNMKYTKSFGDDYVPGDPNTNKEGDLSPKFPLISIRIIRNYPEL